MVCPLPLPRLLQCAEFDGVFRVERCLLVLELRALSRQQPVALRELRDVGGVLPGGLLDLQEERRPRRCPLRFRRVRPRVRRISSRPLRGQPLPQCFNEPVQARDETERSLQNASPVREGAREFSIHAKELIACPPRFTGCRRAHGHGVF